MDNVKLPAGKQQPSPLLPRDWARTVLLSANTTVIKKEPDSDDDEECLVCGGSKCQHCSHSFDEDMQSANELFATFGTDLPEKAFKWVPVEHSNKSCPVSGDLLIEAWNTNGDTRLGKASEFNWDRSSKVPSVSWYRPRSTDLWDSWPLKVGPQFVHFKRQSWIGEVRLASLSCPIKGSLIFVSRGSLTYELWENLPSTMKFSPLEWPSHPQN